MDMCPYRTKKAPHDCELFFYTVPGTSITGTVNPISLFRSQGDYVRDNYRETRHS